MPSPSAATSFERAWIAAPSTPPPPPSSEEEEAPAGSCEGRIVLVSASEAGGAQRSQWTCVSNDSWLLKLPGS